jgi:hypothetical protein
MGSGLFIPSCLKINIGVFLGFWGFFLFHGLQVTQKPILYPIGFKEAGFPSCKIDYSAFCARIPVIGKNMLKNASISPVMIAGFLKNAPCFSPGYRFLAFGGCRVKKDCLWSCKNFHCFGARFFDFMVFLP